MNVGIVVAFGAMIFVTWSIISTIPSVFDTPSVSILIPGVDMPGSSIYVPFISGVSPKEAAQKIHVTANIPKSIFGEFEEGTQFGTLSYSLDGRILNTVPLVTDRKSEKVNFFARIWGALAYKISSLK